MTAGCVSIWQSIVATSEENRRYLNERPQEVDSETAPAVSVTRRSSLPAWKGVHVARRAAGSARRACAERFTAASHQIHRLATSATLRCSVATVAHPHDGVVS